MIGENEFDVERGTRGELENGERGRIRRRSEEQKKRTHRENSEYYISNVTGLDDKFVIATPYVGRRFLGRTPHTTNCPDKNCLQKGCCSCSAAAFRSTMYVPGISALNFDETYRKYDNVLRCISLKIHEYHELAFQEHKSAKILSGFLEDEGFQVTRAVGDLPTAFAATFS